MTTPLRVAQIGYGFMGAAHSQAWRVAPRVFELSRTVEMALLVGRDSTATAEAALRLGWRESDVDWHRAIDRADIDLVDICAPSDVHADIAVAALAAGKHVLCEKPLANSAAEALRMADAGDIAGAAGTFGMVGFTYRRVPAIQLMRNLVQEGNIGRVREVRAQYLQDWLSDSSAPMSWRLDRKVAGSGALGDLASHIVDAVQFVTGQNISTVAATTRTYVDERPLQGSNGTARGRVTVDDSVALLADLDDGALATFEATRMASGRKNALRLEVSGSTGAVAFDLEDLNYLQYYRASDGATAGFRRVMVTEPSHPYLSAWWPPGHSLGYEHAFSHQVADLVNGIASGRQPEPSFRDGFQVQLVLDAVQRSAVSRAWVEVSPPGIGET